MPLPLYLAMTAAEISKNSVLPDHLAYMACHFSPYGTGLSNLPDDLPAGSMVILNDRIPVHGHDPGRISEQLNALIDKYKVDTVLLDLERPPTEEGATIVRRLCKELPCPVGITAQYAEDLDVAVFVSAPPHSQDWEVFQGRRIWLEVAVEKTSVRITRDGAQVIPVTDTKEPLPFFCESLFAHYGIQLSDDHACFHFSRNKEDILRLLESCHGIEYAVGLWQQLKD